MNQTVIEKKIIKRLENLRQWQFSPLSAISLAGLIGEDEREPETPLLLKEGLLWGGARKNFDVCASVVFPEREENEASLVLCLRLGSTHLTDSLSFLYGPEAILLIDETPVSGIDPNHSVIRLPREFLDGRPHELRLDGWTGLADEIYQVGFIGLAAENEEVCHYFDALSVCNDTAKSISDPTLKARLVDILNASLNRAPLSGPDSPGFRRAISEADGFLRGELCRLPTNSLCNVTACGHGHLDLAWLWRTDIARKKSVRTFLNALRLIERYELFFYSQTQAQLYRWMEHDYPEVFKQVKEQIQQGRWELLGGMWVEPDCNITGAESLVRQFILYHSYTTETFGTTGTPAVWLPDSFGFCGQFPQIMKGAGIRWFATAKLTWNQYNKMPSESFQWRGIDGTEILSHIVSVSKPKWFGGTYSADLTPEELLTTEGKAENRLLSRNMLFAYGNGDGGGGPTEEMLRRAGVISDGYPGLPTVTLGTFWDFFQKLSEEKSLPVWEGELYLELHRGTYTSQSETKRGNRECETALNRAEFLCTWVNLVFRATYPRHMLNSCWESLCLNQFHDILPGSSIHAVYEDTARHHHTIIKTCDTLCQDALRVLEGRIACGASLLAINSSPFGQQGLIRVPFPVQRQMLVGRSDGKPLPQFCLCEDRYIRVEDIPSYGYQAFTLMDAGECGACQSLKFVPLEPEAPLQLENEHLRVCFDEKGEIFSWFDLDNCRQLVPEGGRMAQWRLYDDVPGDWDAWDIDEDYTDRGFSSSCLLSVEKLSVKDCAQIIRMRKQIGSSLIDEEVILLSNTNTLDFHCSVDAHETHKLLRLFNEVNIHAPFAEFGTQFGSVLRPTFRNTSWDEAKFECCMQGWVDLSEGDYGVGLACDNRYGVSVSENSISLAVQKSATFPDEYAEQGRHEMRFSIIPHVGRQRDAVLQTSYRLKRPLWLREIEKPCGENWQEGFAASTNEALVIETIKLAERENAIVMRVYEGNNTRGSGEIHLCVPFERAETANLLEESSGEVALEDGKLRFLFRPYEIKTFILHPEE